MRHLCSVSQTSCPKLLEITVTCNWIGSPGQYCPLRQMFKLLPTLNFFLSDFTLVHHFALMVPWYSYTISGEQFLRVIQLDTMGLLFRRRPNGTSNCYFFLAQCSLLIIFTDLDLNYKKILPCFTTKVIGSLKHLLYLCACQSPNECWLLLF